MLEMKIVCGRQENLGGESVLNMSRCLGRRGVHAEFWRRNFLGELRRSCTDDINMELGRHTLLLSWDIDVCMSGS